CVMVGIPLIAGSLGFPAIRLVRPRPRWARLMRQPGMAAACAAWVVIVTHLAGMAAVWLNDPQRPARPIAAPLRSFWYVYRLPVGPAVAAVWLALALGGRWRPERSWVDRLGRAIGWAWIGLALVAQW